LIYPKEKNKKTIFFLINDQEKLLKDFFYDFPKTKEKIIQNAELIINHKFDLLGSGLINLGNKIDWHIDFISGYQFDSKKYYFWIKPASYPGGYDIKVPWELSRCQHFIQLGQAYWLTNNEKYVKEFISQVEDWVEQNPWPYGVNWVSTMDVSIRVVNWIWGYFFFKNSILITDEFHLKFYKSIILHGRHIFNNLENNVEFINNHYLSNLVALIFIGIFIPEVKEAKKWLEFGLKEFWIEILRQFHVDGVNFEYSISYHRLSLELVISAVILCHINNIEVPKSVIQRLEKTLEFTLFYTKPDGSAPIIGDSDNGRLHRLSVFDPPGREWVDHRYLLAIGSVLFNRHDFAQVGDDNWIDAFWLLGKEAIKYKNQFDSITNPNIFLPSNGFVNGGFFVLRDKNIHTTIHLISVNNCNFGSHIHNDSLSFELFLDGFTWIMDAGTFTYTKDYEKRNYFRSTNLHNSIQINDFDQFVRDPKNIFMVDNIGQTKIIKWESDCERDWLIGEFDWSQKTNHKTIHRREFYLNKISRQLKIEDSIIGFGKNKISTTLILPIKLKVNIDNHNLSIINESPKFIRANYPKGAKINLHKSVISPNYGVMAEASIINVIHEDFQLSSNLTKFSEMLIYY